MYEEAVFVLSGIFFQGLLAVGLQLELRKANFFRREQIFICIELQRRTFAR